MQRSNPALAADVGPFEVEWADIGRFAEALTVARKELFAPVYGFRERFALGPRGVWIIGLIANGRIRYQSDIARLWRAGRSTVTDEVAALTRAQLVGAQPDAQDRRQIRLELTEAGHAANAELGRVFADRLNERLAHYRPEEFALCLALLNDLAGAEREQRFAAP